MTGQESIRIMELIAMEEARADEEFRAQAGRRDVDGFEIPVEVV